MNCSHEPYIPKGWRGQKEPYRYIVWTIPVDPEVATTPLRIGESREPEETEEIEVKLCRKCKLLYWEES